MGLIINFYFYFKFFKNKFKGLQKGCVVLPKTSHEENLKTNLDLFDFEIKKEDFEEINKLNKNQHYSWLVNKFKKIKILN
jgi:diketogulonate reductase-like aldo/keto reductase